MATVTSGCRAVVATATGSELRCVTRCRTSALVTPTSYPTPGTSGTIAGVSELKSIEALTAGRATDSVSPSKPRSVNVESGSIAA
jgi:hypothetical protein